MTSKIVRTYTELQKLKTFDERFEYLRLNGSVGISTFGFDRYLNQRFYGTLQWLRARDSVIIRDNGCDLGIEGYGIIDRIVVHHMNPIRIEDIMDNDNSILNTEFLICTSFQTHLALHYGDRYLLHKMPVERKPGDTTPWR